MVEPLIGKERGSLHGRTPANSKWTVTRRRNKSDVVLGHRDLGDVYYRVNFLE